MISVGRAVERMRGRGSVDGGRCEGKLIGEEERRREEVEFKRIPKTDNLSRTKKKLKFYSLMSF